jgi:hypothetical protein
MRTAADRFAPPPDVDAGWRDLVSSAPPPPPPLPVDASIRISVPTGVRTDGQGCVTRVQFGGDIIVPPAETPSFDASDRRMWMVAGGLMGLATLVLLVLGVLTFRSESSAPAVTATAPAPATTKLTATRATEAALIEPPSVGSARPLIAQHALRHSNTKHARKHKKIAER